MRSHVHLLHSRSLESTENVRCRYASPEDGTAGALVTLNTVTSKKSKGDVSAYATPTQSPRAMATGGPPALPSHISVFGDGRPEDDIAIEAAHAGGVRLPSHISAFGDGDEDDLAFAVKGLKGTAHLHPAVDNTHLGALLFSTSGCPHSAACGR